MAKILKIVDKGVALLCDSIMMVAGTAVVLLIMAGAFLRYVLKIDFYGSEEIVLLFGYWLYFIGSIAAARNRSHLSADMVNVFTSVIPFPLTSAQHTRYALFSASDPAPHWPALW